MNETYGLTFRFEALPGGGLVKVRDDGRRGPAVADEAELWLALVGMGHRARESAEHFAALDVAHQRTCNELAAVQRELVQLKVGMESLPETKRGKR